MHPKPLVSRQGEEARKQALNIAADKFVHRKAQGNMQGIDIYEDFASDESWWAEEVAKRELPQIEALESELQHALQNSRDTFITHCPELTRRLSEEIVRSSRQEPGGIKACRVFVNIVPGMEHVPERPQNAESGVNQRSTLSVGSIELSDDQTVPTFEMYVYLFPSRSPLSKLQAFVASLSSRQKTAGKRNHSQTYSLTNSFVLVKRKLFRSRSSNTRIVRTCSFN